jgi:hypothetical protein
VVEVTTVEAEPVATSELKVGMTVLVKKDPKGNLIGLPPICEVRIKKVAPSGNYFLGMDMRAVLDGRTPTYLDYVWFHRDDIEEVIQDGVQTGGKAETDPERV